MKKSSKKSSKKLRTSKKKLNEGEEGEAQAVPVTASRIVKQLKSPEELPLQIKTPPSPKKEAPPMSARSPTKGQLSRLARPRKIATSKILPESAEKPDMKSSSKKPSIATDLSLKSPKP